MSLPNLWTSSHGFLHRDRLRAEAAAQAGSHALPISRGNLDERLKRLRETLASRLHLEQPDCLLDLRVHGEIICDGYRVQRISFLSSSQIRVTGNLYVPDGSGPFPAVLNMHGHWSQGKVAEHVQKRGHILAQNGIVTLTVDAAGSGERSEVEREWSYHGSTKAAELILCGDSLLAVQVRDNRRALDVLQTLSFVDGTRLGATGASGGGNQTMWLAAMDERIKAAVPVVSVGSFEIYVGACNCMCETLPGGLELAEEWGVLGLIAPRALLIVNALHDQPAFGYEAMSKTCRQLEEVYLLKNARECLDWRLIDMDHGYHRPVLHAMLGWMRHWLAGVPGQAGALPDWNSIPENDLLCFPPGERPEECGYRTVRESLRVQRQGGEPPGTRDELARIVGWKGPIQPGGWMRKRTLKDGAMVGAIQSPRNIPLPTVVNRDFGTTDQEIRLILSPGGKNSEFAIEQWSSASAANALAVAVDLPGVGELAWDSREVGGAKFHDATRACLWLGYTLVGEWAEAITSICLTLRELSPASPIRVIAKGEMAFATLLALALQPIANISLAEHECPESLAQMPSDSLAWCVSGFLGWGDIGTLRTLAALPARASVE